MKKTWKFKVVRRMRGAQGEWFDYPTAATFDNEEEARAYAARFAAQLRGSSTGRIDVRSRRKVASPVTGWPTHTIHTEVV